MTDGMWDVAKWTYSAHKENIITACCTTKKLAGLWTISYVFSGLQYSQKYVHVCCLYDVYKRQVLTIITQDQALEFSVWW